MDDETLKYVFQADILSRISGPIHSFDTFKQNVLEAFRIWFGVSGLKFVDYRTKSAGAAKYCTANVVSLNLSQSMCDECWEKKYYSSCIYNPNNPRVKKLITGVDGRNYRIVKISDLMSFAEYEESYNYTNVISESGMYYSLVIYFTDGCELISSLSMIRPKCEEDFSDFELEYMNLICPYISNRLNEYVRAEISETFPKILADILENSREPMLLFDSHLMPVTANETARQLGKAFFGSLSYFESSIHEIMRQSLACGKESFTLDNANGQHCKFHINPYRVSESNCHATTYLVRMDTAPDIDSICADQDAKLTSREAEVTKYIAAGLTNKEIAARMYISENTVRKHVENIRIKLGVSNRIAILNKVALLIA